MATIQVEKRKRGIFGWIVASVFWGFNILMTVWITIGWAVLETTMQAEEDEITQAGVAIGGAIGTYMLLSLWFSGAVILGLMMFFTRGKKITITREL